MTSIDKVSGVLSQWAFKVAKGFLPQVGIPANSAVGKFMYGILGMNPAEYNVWNELGFLAEPLIQSVVTPMVNQYLGGMSEEQMKDVVMKFADAFVERAREKGSVNIFGLDIGENAFTDLKSMLVQKFNEDGGLD